jgi:hypothetical protein
MQLNSITWLESENGISYCGFTNSSSGDGLIKLQPGGFKESSKTKKSKLVSQNYLGKNSN